jgi:hypothetical protein
LSTLSKIIAIVIAVALFWAAKTPNAMDALGDAATGIVRPMIIPVVELINKPVFVYLASAAIVISAILVLVSYFFQYIRPQIVAHSNAEFAISALKKPEAGDWSSAVGALERIFTTYKVLLSPWASYMQETKEQGRLPLRRFSLFANGDQQHQLLRSGNFMSALPGYYTSVGLILTFVGLVTALYFAAKGFNSGDMERSRAAIVQLLNASSFKFLTSVAALVSALVISIAHRLMVSSLRNRIAQLLLTTDFYLQNARQEIRKSDGNSDSAPALEAKLDVMIAELVATRQALVAMLAKSKNEAT